MRARLGRARAAAPAVVVQAVRAAVAHRMRAVLSTLGIAIGVATLLAIYAMLAGLTSAFTDQLASLGANTLYVSSRPWVTQGDWWTYRNRPPVTRDDVRALRRHAELPHAVAPIAGTTAGATARGDRLGDVDVRGTTADYLQASTVEVATGRFLSPLESERPQAVAVVGSEVAERIGRADPVGRPLRIGGERVEIVGVLAPQGSSFGRSLDNVVIVPIDTFGRIFGRKRDLTIAVAAAPDALRRAEAEIEEVLRRSRGLRGGRESTFSVNRQDELVDIFGQQTRALFGVAVAVGAIALLVGGIGITNIMLVSVTERIREIGLRRALGARRRTVMSQFLFEASLIAAVGGAVGTATAALACAALAGLAPVAPELSGAAVAGAVALAAAVGVVAGLAPAYRAASVTPIESLRHE